MATSRCVIVGWSLLIGAAQPARAESMSADELLARHKAALAAVRTVQTRVEVRTTLGEESPPMIGEYAASDGRVRASGTQGGRVECLERDGRRLTVRYTTDGKPPSGGIGTAGVRYFPVIAEPNRVGLIRVPRGNLNLAETYKVARTVHPPTWETIDGHRLVRVQADQYYRCNGGQECGPIEMTFWLDPAANYLIARYEDRVRPDSHVVTRGEVIEFYEGKPGVFYPKRTRITHHEAGTVTRQFEATMHDLRLNDPIPDDRFRLVPPIPNMMVHDAFRKTYYRVDAGWNRIGPEKPKTEAVEDVRTRELSRTRSLANAPTVTAAEPSATPLWWRLLVGSLAFAVAASVATLIRERRKAS